MERRTRYPRAAVLGVVLLGVSQTSAQYDMLVHFDDIRIGAQYNLLGAHVFEGDTLYAVVRGIETSVTPEWESQITRVDDIEGTPTPTLLVSNATWKALTGGDIDDTILPGNRMLVRDGFLQFVDTSTDAIYRVNTQTGELSAFVANADLRAHTGLAQARLIDAVAVSPWDEMAIFDQDSNSILLVDPNGALTTLVSAADFQAFYGYLPINAVAGGMTFDARGVLYWTLSKTGSTGSAGGSIYRLDCDGTMELLLAEQNIWDVTFTFGNVGFNDLFAGPDGNLYFYDRDSDSLLYFDPYDPRLPWPTTEIMPPDLLYVYLTEAELVAGPAGNDFVGQLEAYGGRLAWNHSLTADSPHVFARALADLPLLDGDVNRDGVVDLLDYDLFEIDMTAPDVAYDPGAAATVPDCAGYLPPDVNQDGDIDLADFAPLQAAFAG